MGLKRVQFDDQKLSLFQDNVDAALTPLQKAPLTGGKLIQSVPLTSGQDNFVQHTLGYVPTFYFAGIPNVDTRIWSPTSSSLNGSNANATLINLRCSTTCVVSIWVT